MLKVIGCVKCIWCRPWHVYFQIWWSISLQTRPASHSSGSDMWFVGGVARPSFLLHGKMRLTERPPETFDPTMAVLVYNGQSASGSKPSLALLIEWHHWFLGQCRLSWVQIGNLFGLCTSRNEQQYSSKQHAINFTSLARITLVRNNDPGERHGHLQSVRFGTASPVKACGVLSIYSPCKGCLNHNTFHITPP